MAVAQTSPTPPGGALTPHFAGTDAGLAFAEKKWSEAAREFGAWLERHRDASVERRGRATLLLGASRLYAGQPSAAASALDLAIGRIAGLEDYVRLLAARAYLRADKPSKALVHLKAIRPGFVQARQVSQLIARAHKRRPKKAIAAWESHLKAFPDASPAVWLTLAELKLSRGDKKGAAAAYRQVVARAPHTDRARRADRALKRLPRKLRRFTRSELLTRVRALYDKRRYRATIKTAKRLQKLSKKGSAAWCEAAFLKARSLERSKRRAPALPIYEALVRRCKKAASRDLYVDILYFGGKRQLGSGSAERAWVWFSRIGKLAPKHSYVDDTYIHLAEIRRGQGKQRQADALHEKGIEHGGDMVEKSAFELVFRHFEEGRYRKAATLAEKALEHVPSAQMVKARGRLLYWLARSLQKSSQRVRAAVTYARVVREFPLTWYSALAIERLQRMDPRAAKDAVAAAKQVTPVDSIVKRTASRLREPAVARAVELLRLGFATFAKAEIAKLPDRGGDLEWLVARLYASAGDHGRAYRIARWRRPEHQRHWPTKGHQEHWLLAHPKPPQFARFVSRAARAHGVDEALVWAVMRTESAFEADAVSIANAVGLMQLIVPTGKAMARQEGVSGRVDKRRLTDPSLNIRLGSRYLGKLSTRFDAHPALMAAGYNAGPGGPMKWLRQRGGQELDQFVENIPYRETRKYTKSVVTAWLRYRALYGGTGTLPRLALRLPGVE